MKHLHIGFMALAGFFSAALPAAEFPLPPPGDDLIGRTAIAKVRQGDTFPIMARRYNLGYREIALANPDMDPWIPEVGSEVVVPMQFVLPPGPREGIVINLPEMRLYYYVPAENDKPGRVVTFPLGVGREGWSTPVATTRIVRKKANPTWTPPASIRKEHAQKGDPLPPVVPAGPDNPLGEYALYLGLPAYLLHGTNKPDGIGLRVSHGCLRLFPEDINQLFDLVPRGTPVRIIQAPYKLGWRDGQLYLEAHPPDGDGHRPADSLTPLTQQLIAITREKPDFPVDWDAVESAGFRPKGIPVIVGETAAGGPPPTTVGARAKKTPQ